MKKCSKCGRIVSDHYKAGDKCPYCRAYWSDEKPEGYYRNYYSSKSSLNFDPLIIFFRNIFPFLAIGIIGIIAFSTIVNNGMANLPSLSSLVIIGGIGLGCFLFVYSIGFVRALLELKDWDSGLDFLLYIIGGIIGSGVFSVWLSIGILNLETQLYLIGISIVPLVCFFLIYVIGLGIIAYEFYKGLFEDIEFLKEESLLFLGISIGFTVVFAFLNFYASEYVIAWFFTVIAIVGWIVSVPILIISALLLIAVLLEIFGF